MLSKQTSRVEWLAGFAVSERERGKKQTKVHLERTKERKQPLWRLAHVIDSKGQVDNANRIENGGLSVTVHIARIVCRSTGRR